MRTPIHTATPNTSSNAGLGLEHRDVLVFFRLVMRERQISARQPRRTVSSDVYTSDTVLCERRLLVYDHPTVLSVKHLMRARGRSWQMRKVIFVTLAFEVERM